MDKAVHTAPFHLDHIALAIKKGLAPDNEGKATKKGMTLPDLGCLAADRLGEKMKGLRRSQEDAAVLPVLRDHRKHLGRKVLALIRGKPVLRFVNKDDHTLHPVLVVNELPPMAQIVIVALDVDIVDELRLTVAPLQLERELHRRYRLASTLAPGENDAALVREEIRRTVGLVDHKLPRRVPKDLLEEKKARLVPAPAFWHLKPSPREQDPLQEHRKDKQEKSGRRDIQRPLDNDKQNLKD